MQPQQQRGPGGPNPTALVPERVVGQILSRSAALECVDTAFRLLATGEAVNQPRLRSRMDGRAINVMWAMAPTLHTMLLKSYPVVRSDVSQASVIFLTLYSMVDGSCRALMRGDHLGRVRTGAASAVAARALARPDSRSVAVFGSGYQAAEQVLALPQVLPSIERVSVVPRTRARGETFAAMLRSELPGITVEVTDAESAVRGADVVVTATSSREPVFDGEWLRPGTHINAVGSNHPDAREIDGRTVGRADVVAVDSQDTARLECGDLLVNGFDVDGTVEMGAILLGESPARTGDDQITLYESHGLAVQDLVCADYILGRLDRTQIEESSFLQDKWLT